MHRDADPADQRDPLADAAAEASASRPRDHVEAIADLAPTLWEEVVLQTVRDVHAAIADRAFGVIPGAAPVRAVHDGIADAVYGVLGRATRGTRTAAGALARATADARDPDALERSRAWRQAIAILNGVLGDVLEEQGNPLALPMTVRVGARDVAVDRQALAAAYPGATSTVVVMVHGLVEHDESWAAGADPAATDLPAAVEAAGATPVLLRYNTGRHISANAADLDDLLERLVRAWPAPVGRIVLVGHSMGGLVIRSAGAHARATGSTWPGLASDVVTLGTPHDGAPLERVAHAGAWLLSAVPEARAFGAVLKRRSAGIKDLRHGWLREEDWQDVDVDALGSRRGDAIESLLEARHHVVGATLGPTERSARSRAFGDLLVWWGSASASGHEWARAATVLHVGSADHFALLRHADVAALLEGVIADVP